MNQIWLYPSLGNAFISLEISSQFFIFFSLFSFILAWTFISLQIKEFRIMSLSINDSVYSCLFFFLTGLHFFHLSFGLFLSCLLFWSCSFPFHFWRSRRHLSFRPRDWCWSGFLFLGRSSSFSLCSRILHLLYCHEDAEDVVTRMN